jgi:hypothetical protein
MARETLSAWFVPVDECLKCDAIDRILRPRVVGGEFSGADLHRA